MKKQRISVTTQALIMISALLLTFSILLGSMLLSRSKSLMMILINQRMLDIANSSADMLDGDFLRTIREDDIGSPEFQKSYDTLKVFQDNIDLEYIYTVRDEGDGRFTFTVDPAEDDPGEYGEEIVVTPALLVAAQGTAAVDKDPYEDAWGKFYSAYSPVFDSSGKVGAIVCVDFRADWYEQQITNYAKTVVLFSLLFLLVGASMVLIITSRLRSRVRQLNEELDELTGDVDELLHEIGSGADDISVVTDARSGDGKGDEMGGLSERIRFMRDNLRHYIDQMHAQANGMITAMASDYRSVYYIDLDSGEGICYRAHSKIDNSLAEGEKFNFHDVFTNYAERYVAESYREEFLRLITPENIRHELEKESIVAHRYLVERDGRESYEMLRMAGVRHPEDRTDHLIHAIAVGFTDVDKETRDTLYQQQALSDALALAEEANRAKTAFLSSMSHEIRTPMNAIIGLDSIALNDPEISNKTREYLQKIGDSARHLLGLINDILDMSRIESGRMTVKNEAFSLPKLIEQINTMVGGQCRDKGLVYDCRVADGLDGWYIGDDMKLKQVLINILGNSVKFTPEGGTVTLAVERTAHYQGKTTLRFSMSDTGIGMDKAFLPKLFEAFSQEDSSTTNKYGSTGLGMAITKSIVEMMNGRIEVESEKGVGTTFFVTLTLMDGKSPNGEVNDPQGMNVLIIDDDPVDSEHARLMLEQVGIASEIASSGAEALELVRLRHARREEYNLILVDRKMPEMDGVETTRRIREILGGESTIVMLTAYSWEDVQEEAIRAGVNSFIAKPLVAENVMDEFRRALRRKHELAPERKAVLEGRRVLLAEDMEINAEIMREVLSMREIEAEHAENGKMAVEMFASHPEGWYDAILMDMRMPEMDGLEASVAIRAMDRPDAKTIPIIALTANAFDEDVQHSLQAGLNAHLSKPVEPDSLFATLESLL